jgi:hypothetical protein
VASWTAGAGFSLLAMSAFAELIMAAKVVQMIEGQGKRSAK